MGFPASPFAGTARYYAQFRPPYAQAAIDYIIAAFGLGDGARSLDLGCGPGTIAIPLSRSVAEVVAVDPDAGMMEEGRRLAAEKRRINIRWVQARAESISVDLGRFSAVTIGQSFHWMDRDLATLYVAIKYREVRKVLAGAFFVSSWTCWYLWVTGVSLPIVLPYVGPVSVETPEISGQRAVVHLVLFLLCFYFGFISKPKQPKQPKQSK